jgi:peptidoglycan/LPS O-acetylase OafA/YrhL
MPPLPGSGTATSYNLDFLRACAVLFVFVGHLLQTLHVEKIVGVITIYDMAQTGVMMFFVHTSLVLMLSLERQYWMGGPGLFASFYIRRAFRIYPLAIVIVAVMVLGHVPSFPTLAYSPPTWQTVMSNLALIQNLTTSPSLYAPLWSLPYEVQMYLVLPFLFVVLRKRWQVSWLAFALYAITACIIVLFGAMRIHGISLFEYFPCFLAGVVAYRRWSSGERQVPFWVWPLVILGCVLLRSVVVSGAGGHALLPSGWIACLTLGWTAPLIGELRIRWLQRAASTIAKYSYGIYLSHAIVLWLAFVALKEAPLALQIGVWLVGSVGLPVLCYRVVEDPMIAVGVRITRSMTRRSKAVERCEVPA